MIVPCGLRYRQCVRKRHLGGFIDHENIDPRFAALASAQSQARGRPATGHLRRDRR